MGSSNEDAPEEKKPAGGAESPRTPEPAAPVVVSGSDPAPAIPVVPGDLLASSAVALAALARIQQEMMTFVACRLRADLDCQADLVRCRSWDEVRDVQARFWRAAVEDYARNAARMTEIGAETMRRGAVPAG